MMQILFGVIIKIIIKLVSVLLEPIQQLIQSLLPSFQNGISAIGLLLSYLSNVIIFCLDATGLSSTAIFFIVSYYSFVVVATTTAYIVKLALKWYNALKP